MTRILVDALRLSTLHSCLWGTRGLSPANLSILIAEGSATKTPQSHASQP